MRTCVDPQEKKNSGGEDIIGCPFTFMKFNPHLIFFRPHQYDYSFALFIYKPEAICGIFFPSPLNHDFQGYSAVLFSSVRVC